MSSPIKYPIQGALVLITGFTLIALGLVLPFTKTPQENPHGELIIPGFFIVFACVPVALGVHVDFCCGTGENNVLYESAGVPDRSTCGKPIGSAPAAPAAARCAVCVVGATGTVCGVGAAGQILDLSSDALR